MSEEKTPLLTRISKELATLMDGHANREHVVLPFLHQLVAELPATDRIEALERENAALRDDDAKMQLLHQQEDQLIAAERKVAELEADKARLSEALRGIADAIRNGLTENGLPDHRIKIGEGCRIEDGFLVGPGADTIRDMLALMRDLSDAALSGSGSGWREPEPIKEVKALRQALLECRERAETGGRRIETAMDACEDISEIATCALPPEGWQGPAAPQQGGE